MDFTAFRKSDTPESSVVSDCLDETLFRCHASELVPQNCQKGSLATKRIYM